MVSNAPMKRTAWILGITAAVMLGRLGWVWLERSDSTARMQRAREASRRQAQGNPARDDDAVRILQFYANVAEVIEGRQGIVCYGVENARSVRMTPPVEQLYPAFSRCFWVEPEADTTYTLYAEGHDGREISRSFTLHFKKAPPTILFVGLSNRQIERGNPITMCYGVEHADAVRLKPIGLPLRPLKKDCTRFYPAVTTKYTLEAAGPNGPPDPEAFTIRVR